MTKKNINSRAKGCRGEVSFAKELGFYGINAIRGQQKYGSSATPDVLHDMPGIWFEVKYNEKMYTCSRLLDEALDQAIGDSPPSFMPVVAWRRSHDKWKATFLFEVYPNNLTPSQVPVTMDFEDFMYARGYVRNKESVYVSPKQDQNPKWLQRTVTGTNTEGT
jgi:hypothetical protein